MAMNYTLAYPENGKKRCREVFVNSRFSFSRYFPGRNPWMHCHDKAVADWEEMKIRSRIAFCDAADLKEAKSYGPLRDIAKLTGLQPWGKPPGFDHTKVWCRPQVESGRGASQRQYLVTTEPYGSCAEMLAFYRKLGLLTYACRSGIGLWNPAPHRAGTRLILITPPRNGLPVPDIAEAIEAALPEWPEKYSLADYSINNQMTDLQS
jgi:hypothetical protein